METKAVFVIFCVMLYCSLEAYGQQPQASFVQTGQVSIREADGRFEVCVNVTNGDNITDTGAEVAVSVIDDTAKGGEDYRLEQNIIIFTRERTNGCASFEVIQDNMVENTESLLVRITSSDVEIDPRADIVTVSIEDSDNLTVGFTQRMYTALESSPTFDLCTRLEEGRVAAGVDPVRVRFSVIMDTAINNEDFMMPLMNSFAFSNSTTVGSLQCVQFTIVNDSIIEKNETFSVVLREVDSVIFSERDTTVMIQDNDFATVALDRSQEMVREGNDTMNQTLVFNVVLTNSKGGVDRDVIVNISAFEISATGLNDFVLLNDSVIFPVDSRTTEMQPFYVTILGDDFIETDEVFAINISTVFLDIVGDPGSATVTINRDGDSICSTLSNPTNGMVEMINNTVGSIATYSCFINYMLIGPEKRNCTADVGWSGEDPQCLRICGELSIERGSVETGLSVEGVVANYTCETGYILMGNAQRVCQSNGLWNGTDPNCQAIPDETTTPPLDGGVFDNSRSIGIGVGVGVGGFLLILVVVILVVISILLIRRSKSSKRYIVNRGNSSKRKPSVSESSISIGDSLQETPSTEHLVDEAVLNNHGVNDLNNETNVKMEPTEMMELNEANGETDLNDIDEAIDDNDKNDPNKINYEKMDLSEKAAETPADNETSLTAKIDC